MRCFYEKVKTFFLCSGQISFCFLILIFGISPILFSFINTSLENSEEMKSYYEKFSLKKQKNEPGKVLFKFPESKLAHDLLDGLRGLEIGGSAHNAFGLKTLNVDFSDDPNTVFKKAEVEICGEYMPVHIVAAGDDLPFKDNTVDFVISSHVIEHFYDPVKAVKEWLRVVRPGGYVYIIAPHKERTFDRDRPRTPLAEIIDRHFHPNPPVIDHHGHYSVWITQDFIDICTYFGWSVVAIQDVDDKVGNGFAIVIKK